MIDKSRIAIYDYLYNMFYGVVTNNVYSMTLPTDAVASDVDDGFLVTSVGDINDESEFDGSAYAWCRCYVYAYVPKRSRGRLDKAKYKAFEDAINDVIKAQELSFDEKYFVMAESTISMDDNEDTQRGNQFTVFAKSFVVVINDK